MKQILFIFLFYPLSLLAQEQDKLSFLVGKWEVERTYSPNQDPRELKGTLLCQWALDSTYIACTYDIARPQKKRGLDQVFFNYNPIYGVYESMWLSSTWPIKVIMKGKYQGNSFIYEADFPIQDGIMEFVKSEWTLQLDQTIPSFSRKTHIRTSRDDSEDWFHHMDEKATLLPNPNQP